MWANIPYDYAFYEFPELTPRLASGITDRDPVVWYLCAMVAELAYYNVPAFEMRDDDRRRAKLVPCDSYNEIIARAQGPTDVELLLGRLRFGDFGIQSFVRYTDNTLVLAMLHQKMLFIGFRGTRFLFDFGIDFRTELVEQPEALDRFGMNGRVHRGFAAEAERITRTIEKALGEANWVFEYVLLCGHSLGGAVAALSQPLIRRSIGCDARAYLFASPRYGDDAAYSGAMVPPVSIQRPDDPIPYWPRISGYADHPKPIDTSGMPISGKRNSAGTTSDVLLHRSEHEMGRYRRELGVPASAISRMNYLVPFPRW